MLYDDKDVRMPISCMVQHLSQINFFESTENYFKIMMENCFSIFHSFFQSSAPITKLIVKSRQVLVLFIQNDAGAMHAKNN